MWILSTKISRVVKSLDVNFTPEGFQNHTDGYTLASAFQILSDGPPTCPRGRHQCFMETIMEYNLNSAFPQTKNSFPLHSLGHYHPPSNTTATQESNFLSTTTCFPSMLIHPTASPLKSVMHFPFLSISVTD